MCKDCDKKSKMNKKTTDAFIESLNVKHAFIVLDDGDKTSILVKGTPVGVVSAIARSIADDEQATAIVEAAIKFARIQR